MAMGLFEQLSWLTTRVKRLCCAVEKLQESPSPYKSYIGLISYSSGNLNFANEIYNDTGITINWVPDTYGEGGIQASLLTVPDDSKVVCFVQKQRPQFSTASADYWVWPLIDNTFTYTDVLVVNSVAPNNIVAYIEIRIYP